MPCYSVLQSARLAEVSLEPGRSRLWRLSVNSALQITGQMVPLFAAAIAIPVIYRRVAAADFGVFTLALSALGLFSMMDLGLGRATVRFISRALARDDHHEADAVASQSVVWLGLLSLALCLLFVLFVPGAATKWVPGEAVAGGHLRHVIYILAISIPFLGVTSSLRSMLEARERFSSIAWIQGVFGGLTYAAPLVASLLTPDIRVIVGAAVASRILAFGAFWAVTRAFRTSRISVQQAWILRGGEFLHFSGWLVVSNIVGNIVVYSDRALVASLLPLARLPFYNVPLEMLTRLMIVVNGAITAAFPFLSRAAVDTENLDRMHLLALAAMGACAAPTFLIAGLLAPMGLEVWLGPDFRAASSEVVRILLIGLLFLSLNALSLASLNARGISRRVALMHVTEAPLYLWALTFFGHRFELIGIAVVWSARMVVEFICYALMHCIGTPKWHKQLAGAGLGALQAVPLILLALYRRADVAVICVVVTTAASLRIIWSLRQGLQTRPAT